MQGGCSELKGGDNLMEGIDAKDLLASGCFPSLFDMNDHYDGNQGRKIILGSYEPHSTEANYIGGLMWALDASCTVRPHADGKFRHFLSVMLVANEDRPSKFEWNVEGIVEVEVSFLARGAVVMDQSDPTFSTRSGDGSKDVSPYSITDCQIKKQFTFALDNKKRKGESPCVAVVMDEREEEFDIVRRMK
ncbi:hypothetical protein PMAYCL1PPCAC_24875, partial [Pristionchus mayeri]